MEEAELKTDNETLAIPTLAIARKLITQSWRHGRNPGPEPTDYMSYYRRTSKPVAKKGCGLPENNDS